MEGLQATTCWDPQSQVVTPTAQQAIETIHTGEVPWAAACIERTDTDVSDVKAINGQVLMVTTAGRLPRTSILPPHVDRGIGRFLPDRGGSI